jgi:hypothetical protein
MENKYYVPELKDFYPGFEYEQYAPGTGDDWKKETFGLWSEEARFIRAVYEKGFQSGWIRVPYLTQEQVEAEGWKRAWYEHGNTSYEKGELILTTFDDSRRIKINYTTDYQLYDGNCTSINELRTIMRWLKLN